MSVKAVLKEVPAAPVSPLGGQVVRFQLDGKSYKITVALADGESPLGQDDLNALAEKVKQTFQRLADIPNFQRPQKLELDLEIKDKAPSADQAGGKAKSSKEFKILNMPSVSDSTPQQEKAALSLFQRAFNTPVPTPPNQAPVNNASGPQLNPNHLREVGGDGNCLIYSMMDQVAQRTNFSPNQLSKSQKQTAANALRKAVSKSLNLYANKMFSTHKDFSEDPFHGEIEVALRSTLDAGKANKRISIEPPDEPENPQLYKELGITYNKDGKLVINEKALRALLNIQRNHNQYALSKKLLLRYYAQHILIETTYLDLPFMRALQTLVPSKFKTKNNIADYYLNRRPEFFIACRKISPESQKLNADLVFNREGSALDKERGQININNTDVVFYNGTLYDDGGHFVSIDRKSKTFQGVIDSLNPTGQQPSQKPAKSKHSKPAKEPTPDDFLQKADIDNHNFEEQFAEFVRLLNKKQASHFTEEQTRNLLADSLTLHLKELKASRKTNNPEELLYFSVLNNIVRDIRHYLREKGGGLIPFEGIMGSKIQMILGDEPNSTPTKDISADDRETLINYFAAFIKAGYAFPRSLQSIYDLYTDLRASS